MFVSFRLLGVCFTGWVCVGFCSRLFGCLFCLVFVVVDLLLRVFTFVLNCFLVCMLIVLFLRMFCLLCYCYMVLALLIRYCLFCLVCCSFVVWVLLR